MLKCTGFFRGIECPYERAEGEARCRRPYCHFRHGGRGGSNSSNNNSTCGNNNNNSSSSGTESGAQELDYDLYSPDIPKPSSRGEDESIHDVSDSQLGILELERVNKAIEAVKSEVEREQKRYAELLETKKDYSVSEASQQASRDEHKRAADASDSFSTVKYDPGSYQPNNSANYNPTPLTASTMGLSKYSLGGSDGIIAKKSSIEYVPTVVAHAHKTRPVVCKKYVVDKSKPLTDLEYDPLSNYSARLLSKANKDQKRTKRSRVSSLEDSYTPSLKRQCNSISSSEPLARFSDSEEDIGSESQLSPPNLQPSIMPIENELGKTVSSTEKTEITKKEQQGIRDLREIAVQYDVEDIKSAEKEISEDGLEKKKKVLTDKPLSCKSEKSKELSKDKSEKSKEMSKDKSEKSKEMSKDKAKAKKEKSKGSNKDMEIKEKKKNVEKGKTEKGETGKLKSSEKNSKEKLDKLDKTKMDASVVCEKPNVEKTGKLKKERSRSTSVSAKTKSGETSKEPISEKLLSGKNKKDLKLKVTEIKNGRHSSGTKHKNSKEDVSAKPVADKTHKLSKSVSDKAKPAPKQRSLSHVDLFGDESEDDEPVQSHTVPRFDPSSESDEDHGTSTLRKNKKKKKHVKNAKPSNSKSSVSSSTSSDVDYSSLEKYLDFDSDPMEECLRIFQESSDVKTEDKGRQRNQASKEENTEDQTDGGNLLPGQKRRISHLGNSGNAETQSKPVIRPYHRPTPQEVCYQRIRQAQQQAAQLVAQQKANKQQEIQPHTVVTKALITVPGERKRVAYGQIGAQSAASKASLSHEVKKASVTVSSVKSVNGSSSSSASLKARTMSGMTSKTTTASSQKRVAHSPSMQSASLKRPVIPTEFGAKVPTNVRQRYLNTFIDECLKFCSSEQEAFDKALSEEKVVYDRSSSRNIYLNVAVNTVKKLRNMAPGSPPVLTKSGNKKTISHEAMLGGKLAAKTSFSLNRSVSLREEDLTEVTLFRKLKEYLLTEEQMKENGYPMPHSDKPGRAVIFTTEEKKISDALCRVCCRCGTEYFVSVSGNCIRKEECVHHWGRLRRQRVPGGWETHYSCCSGAVGTPGCQVAKQHVQDGRKEQLDGFVKTFQKETPADKCPGIFALDCEMCYTNQGLELTRITVINSTLKVVYDTFVKPENKVVDYNTRFSGVTEEDLEHTQITLRDVQAVLLNMFCSETILIGHSLESDLFALKLIHCTVVDTAIVFPHRLGLPYKRALRTLMADYLKRIIQDNVDGHDSSEDACSCMELMIWKIKEDAKVKR